MARPKSPALTEAELRLMEILWSRGSGTVADVVDALPPETDLAYSTVLTTLRILEEKGYLRHEKSGRAFVYEPVVEKTTAQRSALKHLLTRFFGNRPELLVQNLLEDEDLSASEIRRLKKMIAREDDRS
jgi:predicted transcriptional regulator